MTLEMKERFGGPTTTTITGNIPTYAVTSETREGNTWHQRTHSQENPLFHWLERIKVDPSLSAPYIVDFLSRQDFGSAFRTERGSIHSNYTGLTLQNYYSGPYSWTLDGPLYLAGFNTPMSLATPQEIVNQNAVMFALGGAAIARTRPGKPQVDLATAIGELRFGGVPKIIGSLYQEARNFKELARETGNEYLNLQFGWAPLIRDLDSVLKLVLNTRAVLQAHEKQLNKLLRRTYEFDTLIDTTQGNLAPKSYYDLEPWASRSGSFVRTGVSTGNQVPIQIERRVTKSHFSAGFRFYYPEIDTALNDLVEFEHQANLLLGTRLDPEVLWNLQPWTWLVDWFINFGDVLGNLSAVINDGLVMQYGYIMQETEIRKEITLPKGLFSQGFYPQGQSVYTMRPFEVTLSYHSKVRAKASPFGFGLTPEMFSPQQWAILAALGISRGLK